MTQGGEFQHPWLLWGFVWAGAAFTQPGPTRTWSQGVGALTELLSKNSLTDLLLHPFFS